RRGSPARSSGPRQRCSCLHVSACLGKVGSGSPALTCTNLRIRTASLHNASVNDPAEREALRGILPADCAQPFGRCGFDIHTIGFMKMMVWTPPLLGHFSDGLPE